MSESLFSIGPTGDATHDVEAVFTDGRVVRLAARQVTVLWVLLEAAAPVALADPTRRYFLKPNRLGVLLAGTTMG